MGQGLCRLAGRGREDVDDLPQQAVDLSLIIQVISSRRWGVRPHPDAEYACVTKTKHILVRGVVPHEQRPGRTQLAHDFQQGVSLARRAPRHDVLNELA